MRICIFGAGAVGGHIAAKLAVAGHDVSAVARGPNLAALKAGGIALREGERTFAGRVRASDNAAQLGAQDVIFVTTKATALAAFAEAAAPLSGANTSFVFVQNGIPWWYAQGLSAGRPEPPDLSRLDPGGALARAIPAANVIGGVVYSSNNVTAPGQIDNFSEGRNMLVVGETDDRQTPRIAALRELLNAAGMYSPPATDIRQSVWDKLQINFGSTLCVPLGLPLSALTDDPALRAARERLIAEGAAIAQAHGVSLQGVPKRQGGQQLSGATRHKPSMLQDYELGRPMEVEAILALPCAFARAAGVDAPALQQLTAVTARLAAHKGLYPLHETRGSGEEMSKILDKLRQAEAHREQVIAERKRLEAEANAALAAHEIEERGARATAPAAPPAVTAPEETAPPAPVTPARPPAPARKAEPSLVTVETQRLAAAREREQLERENLEYEQAQLAAQTAAAALARERETVEAQASALAAERTAVAQQSAALAAARLASEKAAAQSARERAEADAKSLVEERRLADAQREATRAEQQRAGAEAAALGATRERENLERENLALAQAQLTAQSEAAALAREREAAEAQASALATERALAAKQSAALAAERLASEQAAAQSARERADADAKALEDERRLTDAQLEATRAAQQRAGAEAAALEAARAREAEAARASADARQRSAADADATRLAVERRQAEKRVAQEEKERARAEKRAAAQAAERQRAEQPAAPEAEAPAAGRRWIAVVAALLLGLAIAVPFIKQEPVSKPQSQGAFALKLDRDLESFAKRLPESEK